MKISSIPMNDLVGPTPALSHDWPHSRPYHEKNANALPFAPVRCMQETKALKEKRYRKSCHKLHGSFGPRDHFDLRRLYCILNNFKMICQLLTSIYNVISGQSNVPPSSEILITMEFLNYQFHLI